MTDTIDMPAFDDVVPLDITAALSDNGPRDEAPQIDDVLSCIECGKTLTYSGRGRKPQRCDEHRKGANKKSAGGTTRALPNDKLARSATEALVQINRVTGFGLRLLQFPETASTIDYCEDVFREQAYQALLTDPALCRQILSAGQVSGKFSLAMAYGIMGTQVGSVALMEYKAKRAEKAEKASDNGESV